MECGPRFLTESYLLCIKITIMSAEDTWLGPNLRNENEQLTQNESS